MIPCEDFQKIVQKSISDAKESRYRRWQGNIKRAMLDGEWKYADTTDSYLDDETIDRLLVEVADHGFYCYHEHRICTHTFHWFVTPPNVLDRLFSLIGFGPKWYYPLKPKQELCNGNLSSL